MTMTMAMVRGTMVPWITTTKTMATGGDDDDDGDGNGATSDKVDNDGDDDDYGNSRQQLWQRRNGQWRDGI